MPAVTVWRWYYDEPALYIICKVNANSDKLLEMLEPHSSFRFQYRLLTMATFYERAVYFVQVKSLSSQGCHSMIKAQFQIVKCFFFRLAYLNGKWE